MPVIATPVPVGSGVLDVTTLARVKAFMADEIKDTTGSDAVIQQMITALSSIFERKMNRLIRRQGYIDYPNVREGQKSLYLRAFPITAIADVRYDLQRDFGTDSIVDSGNYDFVDTDGILIMDKIGFESGVKVLKVSYTGGMAATTSAFISDYPDLAMAADVAVAFWMRRKRKIEASSTSSGAGGSLGLLDPKLPEFVEEALKRHTRKLNF